MIISLISVGQVCTDSLGPGTVPRTLKAVKKVKKESSTKVKGSTSTALVRRKSSNQLGSAPDGGSDTTSGPGNWSLVATGAVTPSLAAASSVKRAQKPKGGKTGAALQKWTPCVMCSRKPED